jgi:hypothetical protein
LVLDLTPTHELNFAELQFANRLHQQLDIHPLLEQFLAEVRVALPIESIWSTLSRVNRIAG